MQGNWLAPLYPPLAVLAARALRAKPAAPVAAAALGLTATAAIYLHIATAWPSFGPADPTLRVGGWRELSAEVAGFAEGRSFVLAEGYAATSLLSFYLPPTLLAVEAGEPERWTFRPPVDLKPPGLAFGRPDFAQDLARRYARVTKLATLSRRVGGVEQESYAVFAVEAATP